MGAVLYVMLRNKGHMKDLSIQRMLIMVVLSVYLGFADGGVDNYAHIGGLISGFLCALLLRTGRKQNG